VVAYFLEASRLCEPAYANLFEAVLKTDEAVELRRYLTSEEGTTQIIHATLNGVPPPSTSSTNAHGSPIPTPPSGQQGTTTPGGSEVPPAVPAWATAPQLNRPVDPAELAHRGLRLVRLLSKKEPRYLAEQKLMLNCIRTLWTKSMSQIPSLSGQVTQFSHTAMSNLASPNQVRQQEDQKILLKCLMSYCRANPIDVDVLFDMLTIFTRERLSLVSLNFVRDFFRKEVATDYTRQEKRLVLSVFLRYLPELNRSADIKVLALQLIIIPMLEATFENPKETNSDVVDSNIVQGIMRDALDPTKWERYTEPLKVELLKLSSLLIEYLKSELLDYRRELIKFVWNHLKHEDNVIRQWAYISVCRFIAAYDTPAKMIHQVYVFLLRSRELDVKDLVRSALDILVPALPRRLPQPDYQKAMKWTRRVLTEDCSSPNHLVLPAHVVVSHPIIFYPYRYALVQPLINPLGRLGLHQGIVHELRQLLISIADLVIAWEVYRKEKLSLPKAPQPPAGEAGVTPSADGAGDDGSVGGGKRPEADQPCDGPPGKRIRTEGGAVPSSSSSVSSASTITADTQPPGATSDGQRPPPRYGLPPTGSSSSAGGSAGPADEDQFTISTTPQMVETILTFLIKNSITTVDLKDNFGPKFSQRCIALFRTCMKLWCNLTAQYKFNIMYLQKVRMKLFAEY